MNNIHLSLNAVKLAEVHAATPFLEGWPLKLRRMAFEQHLTEETFPKCVVCGKLTGYNKATNELSDTCCHECRTLRGTIPKTAFQSLQDREWLYHHRIIKKMSYKDIGSILGVSEVPVMRWCKHHGFLRLKLNESQPEVKALLRNRDFLYQDHVVNRKKVRDIADEIGSSAATVSLWLRRHGIETNEPNSYDRPFVKVSKPTQAIGQYLESLGVRVEYNNRTILNGQEIDILLPDYHIGIEYHGLYHHLYRPEQTKHSLRKDSSYHIGKTKLAAANGLQLLQIFSDEWENRQDIVHSILSGKVGKNQVVYARKCQIVQLQRHEKNAFLIENHLQGNDSSSIWYGLTLDGNIQCVMTFCKSRYNKHYKWELSRFANKQFVNVVGGFSKLLAHFKKHHTGSIVSYADKRWSNGNVYRVNGFQLISDNKPSYYYVDSSYKVRYHRSAFVKKRIAKDGDSRTEIEIMAERGYHQIFDCGTLAFGLD